MKEFVLLNNQTGDLLLGYRVTFLDQDLSSSLDKVTYAIGIMKQDGWVLTHPKLVTPIFLNMHSETFFTNLGEL